MHRISRCAAAAFAAGALAAVAAGPASADPSVVTGPSSSKAPYVLPVADGVSVTSILTAGDSAANGYRMVGVPDGLGATGSERSFTLLSNHELTAGEGITRRHGQKGSFVSRWSIDRRTLAVTSGGDLIAPGVQYWNPAGQSYGTAPLGSATPNPRDATDTFGVDSPIFSRFCSGSLTEPGRLYSRRTGRGYPGQLWFANEENGDNGRLFGVTEDGTAQELPRLGRFSWENTLAADTRSTTTLVVGNEDGASDASQLHVYLGRKTRTGSAFRRAGLTNGTSYVLDVDNPAVTNDVTFRSTYAKGTAVDVGLNQVDWDHSGGRQNTEAKADGLSLNRIEDGAWDPENPNDYWFVTTAGGKGAVGNHDGGGLWKLSFEDLDAPEAGATLTLVLDGSETPAGADGFWKPDNLTIADGNILVQEDTGNDPHVGRILAYSIPRDRLGVVATFDPALFTPGAPGFITQDEESSGIIDASSILGEDTFLLDAQVHKASADPEIVEGGQYLVLRVRSWRKVYGGSGHRWDD